MPDRPKNPTPKDERPAYEPPRVTLLGDIRAGAGGGSCYPGSGDLYGCGIPGNSAAGHCYPFGNAF